MKIILLSGGSGKRLWPLSNESRSKQFLKVLKNQKNEEYESMIQRVWQQLNDCDLQKDTLIATSIEQEKMINLQIGEDVKKVIEPSRRDTFAAIALSCVYLYDVENTPLNENIVIAPVDPFVNLDYFDNLKKLPIVLDESQSNLALMGVKPSYPSTKFGYIETGDKYGDWFKVKSFKEKPNEENAKLLIENNALWNCGVFCFKLETIINLLKNKKLPINHKELEENYELLENNSFDYAFVEKIDSISVLPFDGEWKDLGTWESLSLELKENKIGKVLSDETTINSHIINELDIPIITLGVDDLMIVASPDGILIADKSKTDQLKNIANKVNVTPMFEERYWGSFKILDIVKNGHFEVLTKRVRINSGKSISYQYHELRTEIWTILSGEAEILIDGSYKLINTGDTVMIPPKMKHSIKAISNVEMIEIQQGVINGNDVKRIEKYLGEAIKL